jgi:hypothetical protein
LFHANSVILYSKKREKYISIGKMKRVYKLSLKSVDVERFQAEAGF